MRDKPTMGSLRTLCQLMDDKRIGGRWWVVVGALILGAGLAGAQVPSANRLWPNLKENIERPIRYRPDGGDFVIENGTEFFNRPLYGGNTAFRVDAGDKPEFVLYLPGRGGNLRIGLRSAEGAKWLHEAADTVSRYRPGEMLYEIRDPLLGRDGVLRLAAVALNRTDGLIVRVEASHVPVGVELVWAYGGVNGERGRRDGDIGTETVPIARWFQLRPEFCGDNAFTLTDDGFTLRSRAATIHGVIPAGSQQSLAGAAQWSSCAGLLKSSGEEGAAPIIAGRMPLGGGKPLFLALQRIDDSEVAVDLETYREVTAGPAEAARAAPREPAYRADELPELFTQAEAHFAALRQQLRVDTPDPFINAAVAALNVAADAVWDEPQGAVMHGAIAWRTKLLGWRGPYAMDALGWQDRARRHLAYWATRQNTDAIPQILPPPDAGANLARSEAALHSSGDMSNSHYDMNLVYIDALFRHLLWTGDLEFAREVWPEIERHLAWEKRLFRREFGPEKLPLYEAYAAIWASDDLQYHGGGTAHASAYNHWHNRMAARLAKMLDLDSAPYEREAGFIARGMRELLWTGDHFAEFKDLLGLQLIHPSAALWTFYHTMDAGLPNSAEAISMSDDALQRLPLIPVKGPGVPDDRDYAVRASTDWLPYSWSINNVVMGENIHTALGLWQAGRPEDAFTLMKSALLASMFMGICPGNVGSMNYLDVYRRESQRDFADGSGVTSRAIVEGLFGIRPDALAGELVIAPGFPWQWTRASLEHPSVAFTYRRDAMTEHYTVTPRFGRPMRVRLLARRLGANAGVTVNGQDIPTGDVRTTDAGVEIVCAPAESCEITVIWQGEAQIVDDRRVMLHPFLLAFPPPENVEHPEPVDLSTHFNDRVTSIFSPGKYVSPRSPFVSLAMPSQGIGAWAGHVNAMAEIDDTGLRATSAAGGGRLTLPDGVPFATPGPGEAPNVLFVSQWDNYPNEAIVPLSGRARHISFLMTGSTNHMQSRIDNGEVIVSYTDGTTARLPLRNPETWWPIEQDYFIDDFQFRVDQPLPMRVDLKTGNVRTLDAGSFKGQGGTVPGGAATVLNLPLDPGKELRSLTVRALANEVVIGLMAATLER